HGEEEKEIDLAEKTQLELAPGDYQLRVADKKEKRTLHPDHFTVESGQSMTVPLRLVGEGRGTDVHPGEIKGLAISPLRGPLWVLSGGADRTVGIWNADGKERPRFFEGRQVEVRAVAFAPGGRRAASGGGNKGGRNDHSVRVWDVPKGEKLA